MITYEQFEFAAPPFSGASWFVNASNRLGLGNVSFCRAYQPFPLDPSPFLRVSLIRHPCDWLLDCFREKHAIEIDGFNTLPRGNFDTFVDAYLQILPGAIGKLFNQYQADTVLKIEDMPWALVELAEALGVPTSAQDRIRDMSQYQIAPYRWDDNRARERVLEAELDFCERYDYF